MKVTELRLRGNKLTVRALEKLTEVVRLSAADLRELDLSQNDIRVETAEDKSVWSAFLKAFQNCFLVRKLDLSGNVIGPVGVEVLARAYAQSELDFVEEDAEDVIGGTGPALRDEGPAESSSSQSASRQSGHGRRGQPRERASASRNNGEFQVDSARDEVAANGRRSPASTHVIPSHELRKFACTRGLRSIPYLILSDIELSSTGAIHFESMLAMQQTPEHLLAFLPQGKAVTVPEAENSNKGSVIWLPNEGLSDHARRLLEVSETISRLNHSSRSSDTSDYDAMSEGSEYGDADAEHKQLDKLKVEYERLSKRVRLDALLKEGVKGSELWSRTLLMLSVSRALLLEDKDRVAENTPETSASEETGESSEAPGQPRESGEEEQQLETQASPEDVSSQDVSPQDVLSPSAEWSRDVTMIGGVETNFSSSEDGDAESTGPQPIQWRQSMTNRLLSHQFHRHQSQRQQEVGHIRFANNLATRAAETARGVSAPAPVQGLFPPQPANRFTTMNPDTMPMEPMQPAQVQMPFFPLAPLPRLSAINRNPLFRPPTPYVTRETIRRDNSEENDSDVDTLPLYEPPEEHHVSLTPPPAYESLSGSDGWRVVGSNPLDLEHGNARPVEARTASHEGISARRDAPNAIGTSGLFPRTASARHEEARQNESSLSPTTQLLARLNIASRPADVDAFAGRPEYESRAQAARVDAFAGRPEYETRAQAARANSFGGRSRYQNRVQAAVALGREAFAAKYRAMRNAEAAHPSIGSLPTYPPIQLPQRVNPPAMSPPSARVGATYANVVGHTASTGGVPGPFQPGSMGFEENFPSLNSAPKAVPQESDDQSSKTESSEEDSNDDSNEGSAGKTTQSSPQSKEFRLKNANRRKPAPRPAQKEEWRFGLSLDRWRQIITEAVNADGILSIAQQNRIIRHASDWDCLKQEISIGGAQNHQQIWKYLETVGCFTYGTI